jgi:hypothetical protein
MQIPIELTKKRKWTKVDLCVVLEFNNPNQLDAFLAQEPLAGAWEEFQREYLEFKKSALTEKLRGPDAGKVITYAVNALSNQVLLFELGDKSMSCDRWPPLKHYARYITSIVT